MNEKMFDEIVAGQKAILEATREATSGKNLVFIIGAISALEGQAEALKKHIMESSPDPLKSMILIKTAEMMYKHAVNRNYELQERSGG